MKTLIHEELERAKRDLLDGCEKWASVGAARTYQDSVLLQLISRYSQVNLMAMLAEATQDMPEATEYDQ